MNRSIAKVVLGSIGAVALSNVANADLVYGLTVANQIVAFDTASPGSISSAVAVTGLELGESLLGIDFRPASGALFGLGNSGRLYTVDTASGIATQVGAGTFAVALEGTNFGFDFNPTVDRIRVTSNTRQNMRLNPITGAVVDFDNGTPGTQPDGTLTYAAGDANAGLLPQIVGSAYTNNFNGTSTTVLYNIDAASGNLVVQGSLPGADPVVSPNSGELSTVGALGLTLTSNSGFDIASGSGIAYLSTNISGSPGSGLYTVNLTTGAATLIGAIGADQLIDIAVTIPAPGSAALIALGAACMIRRRR